MKEEEAVFHLGKQFSKFRNDGHDLPSDPVKVGNSMVLPEELADEYDQHFPPGPRKNRRDTDRQFRYELNYLGEFRMGASQYGLSIYFHDREFDVLKNLVLFRCISTEEFETRIRSSKSNRFDVIRGDGWTFVIDKINETISVARANYRINSSTFCDENPIAGLECVYIEEANYSPLASTSFPFVPFDSFWEIWNGYVAFRKSQIEEIQTTFKSLKTPAKGDNVSVRQAHPEHNLIAGNLGVVVDIMGQDLFAIDFGGRTFPFRGDQLQIHSYSDCT